MGIVPDEVLFCVFYCSANDILQLSLARYDAKCFAITWLWAGGGKSLDDGTW